MAEPTLCVLGGDRGSWSARDRIGESEFLHGIEAWVFAFNGSYNCGTEVRIGDLDGFDIVLANTNFSSLEHLLRICADRPRHIKWVSLIEGDALEYVVPRPFLKEILDSSDLVVTINEHSINFFRQLTTAPVANIGIPYPAEHIRKMSVPISKRRREILLSPMALNRWTEYHCARTAGLPMVSFQRRLSRKLKNLPLMYRHKSLEPGSLVNAARQLYNDTNLTIRQELPLRDFLLFAAGSYLWVNLDPRYTWGRYVLDAAAMQVPIIATRSTVHSSIFFPELTVDTPLDVERARELIDRLITDDDFYVSASTIPIEAFEEYLPAQKKRQLTDILFTTE